MILYTSSFEECCSISATVFMYCALALYNSSSSILDCVNCELICEYCNDRSAYNSSSFCKLRIVSWSCNLLLFNDTMSIFLIDDNARRLLSILSRVCCVLSIADLSCCFFDSNSAISKDTTSPAFISILDGMIDLILDMEFSISVYCLIY